MKYAVRKTTNPDEYLIRQPGGRLDPWGPKGERAEYLDRKTAEAYIRVHRAESFAVVIEATWTGDDSEEADARRRAECRHARVARVRRGSERLSRSTPEQIERMLSADELIRVGELPE